MARIAVYEPAGCCSTGVCDPATSDTMAQFASAMEGLNKQGVDVERFELSSRPDASRPMRRSRLLWKVTVWSVCR